MSKKTMLKAVYGSDEKPLVIGSTSIPCYVLSNGQRVLSQAGLYKALGITKGGTKTGKGGGARLASFMNQKALEPFINKDLTAVLDEPINFVTDKGTSALGYDAELLQTIVRAISKAFISGQLPDHRQAIGSNAERLDDAFSKVGLIALIDEATGYQYEREGQELQKILTAYISSELLPWQARFPHELYKEIFRLRGWAYTAVNIKKKPSVVGHWTNRLIYEQLPNGILKELKKQTPKDDSGKRKHHFHRLLTEDVGHPHLQKQIVSVVTLMSVSDSWEEFIDLFNKKFGQQKLSFDEIEEVKPAPTKTLSGFNARLKKAIEYNPRTKK